MPTIHASQRLFKSLLCGVSLFLTASSIGCDSHVGGHSADTPYYLDNVNYFPPGPEFKLSREAAAQAAKVNEKREARNDEQ
jgi:hypothetical protein